MSEVLEKYAQLRKELEYKDPIKRYEIMREELEEKKKQTEEKRKHEQREFELQKLSSLENLFSSLASGVQLSSVENVENVENVVEEIPVTEASKEASVEVPEDTNEVIEEVLETLPKSIVDDVVSTISKHEKDKEKIEEQVDKSIQKRIDELEKQLKLLTNKINGMSVSGGGSGEVNLHKLDDIDYSSVKEPTNGYVLTYDSVLGKWKAAAPTGGVGGGGATTLITLTDINTDNLTDNALMQYDSASQKFQFITTIDQDEISINAGHY